MEPVTWSLIALAACIAVAAYVLGYIIGFLNGLREMHRAASAALSSMSRGLLSSEELAELIQPPRRKGLCNVDAFRHPK